MKDKNKKIFKGLCVGALACLGFVGLTGCSVEMPSISAEAKTAYSNVMNKVNDTTSDFWSKTHIQVVAVGFQNGQTATQNIEVYMFKSDNQQIFMQKMIGETDSINDNSYILISDNGTNVINVRDDYENGLMGFESDKSFADVCLEEGILFSYGFITGSDDGFRFLNDADIVSAIKNHKGNHVITTVSKLSWGDENEGTYCLIKNEIDSEYNLVSQTCYVDYMEGQNSISSTYVINYTYDFEYTDIQEEVEYLLDSENWYQPGASA